MMSNESDTPTWAMRVFGATQGGPDPATPQAESGALAASHGGDGPCQVCGRHYPSWFAPHEVWNLVMGGPDAKDDPGGLLCPTCFVSRAEENGHLAVWALTQDRVITPASAGDALPDSWDEQVVRAVLEPLDHDVPMTQDAAESALRVAVLALADEAANGATSDDLYWSERMRDLVTTSEQGRRTEAESRICSDTTREWTDMLQRSRVGCPGDGRYEPPGKGHLPDCPHDAVAWVWGPITSPAPQEVRDV